MKVLMTKGQAYIPQRFWDYQYATTPEEQKELEEKGYVPSVNQPDEKEKG